MIQTMDLAVKVKTLLLKDETEGWEKFSDEYWTHAVKLYENGYDARFQTTQTIPVFINELLVRLIYSVRRIIKYYSATPRENRSFVKLWKTCEQFNNVTVKRMLTVAHGTFCMLDVGDAVGRGFATGGGYFNVMEFAMRLNLPGLGRFGISLVGEANRGFKLYRYSHEKWAIEGERIILLDHIEGLKVLADKYDDKDLIRLIDDFINSSAYKEAFDASVKLAEKRGVSSDRILKNKADIDSYFKGGF